MLALQSRPQRRASDSSFSNGSRSALSATGSKWASFSTSTAQQAQNCDQRQRKRQRLGPRAAIQTATPLQVGQAWTLNLDKVWYHARSPFGRQYSARLCLRLPDGCDSQTYCSKFDRQLAMLDSLTLARPGILTQPCAAPKSRRSGRGGLAVHKNGQGEA